jgi:hypothetical protein
MATTTNYGWDTPDDTDLVKDGASAIRTLGSSIDTTTKNLNPSTTLGDIEYRSATANTNTRLGIGTSGQVLTVSAGVPSWATPAGAQGPAFFAKRASTNQTIGLTTYTKVQFNGEDFDTDNCYDPTTNYRFTPNKAGYYQLNSTIYFQNNSRVIALFYKNGAVYQDFYDFSTSTNIMPSGSTLMYLNGTTDYAEVYVYQSGSTRDIFYGSGTVFSGVWIRS